ncbi:helix-turn-helix domain-containing protein [Lunatibacter salilacus]|uniref:helix-turn-helix domain-containing protein n=1 Tax=Lunatibacter salilacus TaxID=2483804 RepID=UPI00131E4F52|nr:helix-turn-helix domain-containing protein [Lunatibacter salilacus]
MSSNIRITRICQFCGNSFTAKTTVTKFCGDRCAKAAYKVRQKEEKINQSNTETSGQINLDWFAVSQKNYLNVKETCVLMGISRTTLWRLVNNHAIEVKEIGRKLIFRKADIETFMNR